MAWIWLGIAGLLEIVWAVGLKYAHGFTRLWPTVVTTVAMLATYVFLAQAVKTIPLGTAYAIWTGVGTVGAALLGMVLFGEPARLDRLLCIGLIVAGVVGLRLVSG
jgi:quaternary ammonium compound-resistance protein SugE